MMIDVLSIVLSLVLLMVLAYRGITVLVLAPLLAMLAVTFSSESHALAYYTEVFMSSFAGYAQKYFPLFLLGAIFGKLMDVSGAAKKIAHTIVQSLGTKYAITAIVLSCGILTYGGVSLFVVAFAIYPVARSLFIAADIPKRLIPGAIALGSFTFSMTALPGSPQIQNSIPMPFFNTTTYAAPIIGTISAILMFFLGTLWFQYRIRQAQSRGEGFGDHPAETSLKISMEMPNFLMALLPILVVIFGNFVFSKLVFPGLDLSFLSEAPFSTSADKVIGIWSIISAVFCAIVILLLSHFRRLEKPIETINEGAKSSLLAIVNTCSEVGYGNVIASLGAFLLIRDWIVNISANPLVSEAISVTILSGITGSASGGLSIALSTLSETYIQLASAHQIPLEVMHRIATIACGGLDSLPHNGAVITLLGICRLSHKQSYLDIGICSVVIPLLTLVVAIILGSLGVT